MFIKGNPREAVKLSASNEVLLTTTVYRDQKTMTQSKVDIQSPPPPLPSS